MWPLDWVKETLICGALNNMCFWVNNIIINKCKEILLIPRVNFWRSDFVRYINNAAYIILYININI